MHFLLKNLRGAHRASFSHYSYLIDQCLTSRSVHIAKTIHAQLLKLGLNNNTFLGNRCLQLYALFGPVHEFFRVFGDIKEKNIVSWNICLKGLFRFGYVNGARNLFDEMPERDIVSWNCMMSGCVSSGFANKAMDVFLEMQDAGFRPSEYTFSIMLSVVSCPIHGKQIHGSMIRSGIDVSNVVLGNSLIDMYGKFGLVDYMFVMFYSMEKVDIISWNSLILGCHRSGFRVLALNQFYLMRATGHSPDQFTVSIMISLCSFLQELELGKQFLAFCFKMGFTSNSIVLSAAIDLFSKCNSLRDAMQLFEEANQWDQALCDAMISSLAWHGHWRDSMWLFVYALRENLRPTGITLSSVLSSISVFTPLDLGSQIHNLVLKLGFESDTVVTSSLVDMYAKIGLIDNAMKVFTDMPSRDLISWNTMIMGLVNNGKYFEALGTLENLVREGVVADRITLAGVLLACSHAGFVDEGLNIFCTMENEHGVVPTNEHYTCVVDLLSRAGKFKEAVNIIETTSCQPTSTFWISLLDACAIHGDMNSIERVAERVMKLEPQSSLPYSVLARVYAARGRWESTVRVRKAMENIAAQKVKACSWVVIKDHVYAFQDDRLQHLRGESLISALELIVWEVEYGNEHKQYV
ncbi:pentatricopeptide repeat-containing protein At1g43980, mitochondrial [Cucurbita pepo subsp. pepo]|uniref:pentatricopeptide repeat-containing protein At1g43980, mitochondrial n=1 Tax=Cucurbita pepo subsp. pepo TaxID=3664 RepID=UPI000C9D7EA0|nr:pentatricopeptide repeat-containing protein At1g43980, mitochondrial [Cucurbita pepo subsp. pepo]